MSLSDTNTIARNFTVPAEVTCLSFDIWKTLLNGNAEFTRPRMALLFELLGHEGLDVELLRRAYLDGSKTLDKVMEDTGIDQGMRPRIQAMYDYLGIEGVIPDDEQLKVIQRQVGQLRLDARYMPTLIESDLIDTLQQLKAAGYRLGLLSNTGFDDRSVMEPVLTKLGLWELFDVALFSSEDGRAKPNPELFLHMVDSFDVLPEQVLHIGDNVNADYRAWEAGLEVVVYAPEGNDQYPSITSMKGLLPQG
ncbi:MAG: HAD family hydrolase [Candidatus Microsaccharimonas sp.]